jgi:hypothetical protein
MREHPQKYQRIRQRGPVNEVMFPRVVNVSAKASATVAGPVTSWQTPNGPFNVEHLAGVSAVGDVIVFGPSGNSVGRRESC